MLLYLKILTKKITVSKKLPSNSIASCFTQVIVQSPTLMERNVEKYNC
jgi:hypothetical protein